MKMRTSRGQTLVEYALMLPLMILIILFLADAGRVVYYSSVIHNAAREGARWGIIDPEDAAGIETAARAKAIGLDPTNLTILSDETKTETEWYITVWVTYDFDLVTPLISVFFGGNPLTLDSQSQMNVEG